MKNFTRLGVIAIIAVICFAMAACDEDEEYDNGVQEDVVTVGSLTIKGLNEFNGQSVGASGYEGTIANSSGDGSSLNTGIYAVASPTNLKFKDGHLEWYDYQSMTTVANGQAVLKVVQKTAGNRPYLTSYTGNDQKVQFRIYKSDGRVGTVVANFTNGLASAYLYPSHNNDHFAGIWIYTENNGDSMKIEGGNGYWTISTKSQNDTLYVEMLRGRYMLNPNDITAVTITVTHGLPPFADNWMVYADLPNEMKQEIPETMMGIMPDGNKFEVNGATFMRQYQ